MIALWLVAASQALSLPKPLHQTTQTPSKGLHISNFILLLEVEMFQEDAPTDSLNAKSGFTPS